MGSKSVMDSRGGVEIEAKCHSHDLVKEVVQVNMCPDFFTRL